MGDSRKHLLNSIDIAFSLYRSRSDSAIAEEELKQLEADLKSEPFLNFLESVFSATFTSRTHWEDKLWELAAHYPIEYLNLSTRSYNGLVRSSYRIRTVADLLKLPLADLKKIRNLGVKSITEIEYAKYRFLEKLEQGKIE